MTVAQWVAEQQGKHFCGCGCGEAIRITARHSEPRRGIPRFIRGHHIRTTNHLCAEREANTQWKGGRARRTGGYVLILMPEHPFATTLGYVAEHRLVAERHLREADPDSPYLMAVDGQKYLRPQVIVHHIDHVRSNNDPDNLVPMTRAEHVRLHDPSQQRPAERVEAASRLRAAGWTLSKIAEHLGVSIATVHGDLAPAN